MSSLFTFSCIVENKPFLLQQLCVWLETLAKLGGIAQADIVVHSTSPLPEHISAIVLERASRIVVVEEFDKRSPHCNKIQQLEALSSVNTPYIVLCDVDIAFSRPFSFSPDSDVDIYAKLVDAEKPPLEVLQQVFKNAGLSADHICSMGTPDSTGNAKMLDNNFNGGLYIVRRQCLTKISKHWSKWAKWILENRSYLGEYSVHVDQVSFAFALTELQLSYELLSNVWNYPTHFKSHAPVEQPFVLHYHHHVDSENRLKRTEWPLVNRGVDAVNSVLDSFARNYFNNKTYWDFRYADNPESSSGVGSRGATLEEKRDVLRSVLQPQEKITLNDIGCGDGELFRDFIFARYTGYDVSDAALASAKGKIPFAQLTNDLDTLRCADMSTCIDVLIHQSSYEVYKETLNTLLSCAKISCLVSGYDKPPPNESPKVFFYEPLRESLTNDKRVEYFFPVSEYRDVVLYYVKLRAVEKHKRDITAQTLYPTLEFVSSKRALAGQLNLAHKTIGFFPDHSPRVIEYPWFAQQFDRLIVCNPTAVDIGAGVSPVPLYYAYSGANVLTTDPHRIVRTPECQSEWNEWGFLDYSIFHSGITSYNAPSQKLRKLEGVDIVYSVSVIEHVPAVDRRRILHRMQKWASPDCALLISLDLHPDTNDLWNFSEGKLVDESRHGDIYTILKELSNHNFEVQSSETVRNIPDSRTDVAFIVAIYKGTSFRKRFMSRIF